MAAVPRHIYQSIYKRRNNEVMRQLNVFNYNLNSKSHFNRTILAHSIYTNNNTIFDFLLNRPDVLITDDVLKEAIGKYSRYEYYFEKLLKHPNIKITTESLKKCVESNKRDVFNDLVNSEHYVYDTDYSDLICCIIREKRYRFLDICINHRFNFGIHQVLEYMMHKDVPDEHLHKILNTYFKESDNEISKTAYQLLGDINSSKELKYPLLHYALESGKYINLLIELGATFEESYKDLKTTPFAALNENKNINNEFDYVLEHYPLSIDVLFGAIRYGNCAMIEKIFKEKPDINLVMDVKEFIEYDDEYQLNKTYNAFGDNIVEITEQIHTQDGISVLFALPLDYKGESENITKILDILQKKGIDILNVCDNNNDTLFMRIMKFIYRCIDDTKIYSGNKLNASLSTLNGFIEYAKQFTPDDLVHNREKQPKTYMKILNILFITSHNDLVIKTLEFLSKNKLCEVDAMKCYSWGWNHTYEDTLYQCLRADNSKYDNKLFEAFIKTNIYFDKIKFKQHLEDKIRNYDRYARRGYGRNYKQESQKYKNLKKMIDQKIIYEKLHDYGMDANNNELTIDENILMLDDTSSSDDY